MHTRTKERKSDLVPTSTEMGPWIRKGASVPNVVNPPKESSVIRAAICTELLNSAKTRPNAASSLKESIPVPLVMA